MNINKLTLGFLFVLSTALFFTTRSNEEEYIPRGKNEFLHYSQVYMENLLPIEKEEYYDSILQSKVPFFKEENRGIIYEIEINHERKDTFWEAFVVLNKQRGSTIVTVVAEGVEMGEAATILIEELEQFQDSVPSLFKSNRVVF